MGLGLLLLLLLLLLLMDTGLTAFIQSTLYCNTFCNIHGHMWLISQFLYYSCLLFGYPFVLGKSLMIFFICAIVVSRFSLRMESTILHNNI